MAQAGGSMPMRRALTLIEVLVVAAIIAVIAEIVIPVYLNAKASGYKTACLSNLRQWSASQLMYVADSGWFALDAHLKGSVPTPVDPSIKFPDSNWMKQLA